MLQSMGLQRVGHDLATEQQLQQHTPSLGIPYIPEELSTVWGTEEILNKHLLSDIYCLLTTSVYCCLPRIILGCKFLLTLLRAHQWGLHLSEIQ